MKLFPVKALMGTAVLLILSCGTVDNAKKYPNMVADTDPISAGTVEIQVERPRSSELSKIGVDAIFYPRLNAVTLEFKYEFINYRQFWDASARRQFAAALERYKADFAARNLVDKYRRTSAAYGKFKGRTEWENFQHGSTHVAKPAIELGYRYKMDAPYFAALMRAAREEAGNNSNRGESHQITMYFTRSQADELVKLFDQSYLMALLEREGSPESDKSKKFLGFDLGVFKRKDRPKTKKTGEVDSY